jgi:sortase A
MRSHRGQHSRPRPRGSRLRILGIVLITAGVVAVGFVPYALYATQVAAHRAQSVLSGALAEPDGPDVAPPANPSTILTRTVALTSRPRIGWPISVPLGTALAHLSIPAAGVENDIVVEGADELRLQEGPGHYPSTPLPGDPGNVSIAGHRTTWLRPVYNLQAASPGDRVILQSGPLIYEYRTTAVFAVAPTDLSVIAPKSGWWLTLTTCNPRFSAAQRLVLRATLVRVERVEAMTISSSLQGRTPAIVEVRVPPPIPIFPATPWPVLLLWLLGVVLGIGTTVVLVRKSRFALCIILPAAACCFEAYSAAVRLLPASW